MTVVLSGNTPSKQAPLRRVAQSTFLLLALGLLACDCLVAIGRPLSWLQFTGLTGIHQNAVVSKLPEILAAPANKDILLLGSSLVQVSTVRCDDKLNGVPSRWDGWYYRYYINPYPKADYLEKLLSTRFQTPVSVCNAAVSASVVSDQFLIASDYLASGKQPKLAIVCVAPREFLDNNRAKYKQTPTAKILTNSLADLVDAGANVSQIGQHLLSRVWNVYRGRTDFRDFLLAVASVQTQRPMNKNEQPIVTSASRHFSQKHYPLYFQPENMVYDLPGYKRMYLPINRQQWSVQTEKFRSLLALLRDHGVATVVVDVPVTGENYALLPKNVLTEYRYFVEQEATRFGAKLVRPGDHIAFNTKTDFEDSAHMNASGGGKLYKAIVDGIASEAELSAALTTSPRAVAQSVSTER